MKIKDFNVLKAFKKVYGNDVELNNTFNDLNPFRQVSTTNDDSILPNHVKDFMAAKKEKEMIQVWKDEIAMKKGEKNE